MSDIYRLVTRRGKEKGKFVTDISYNGDNIGSMINSEELIKPDDQENSFSPSRELKHVIYVYARLNIERMIENPKLSIIEEVIIGNGIK